MSFYFWRIIIKKWETRHEERNSKLLWELGSEKLGDGPLVKNHDKSPKVYFLYSGFESRGGGIVTHYTQLIEGLKKNGIEARGVSLNDFTPFSYLLPLIERIVNLVFFPCGFLLRNSLCRIIWQRFLKQLEPGNCLIAFEDIYTLPKDIRHKYLVFLHALKSDNLQGRRSASFCLNKLHGVEKAILRNIRPITVSEEYNSWVSQKLGCPKLRVLPIGFNPEEYLPGQKENIIAFVGNLEARKNPYFALDVIETLLKTRTNFQAVFLGSGPLYSKVKRRASFLGPNVKVHGTVPHNQVIKVLSKSKVLLLPSSKESFGAVLLEAKLSGCYTLASQGLDVPSELVDYSLPMNQDLWVSTINRLLDNFSIDWDKRLFLAKKYDAKEIAIKMLDMLENFHDE